MNKSFIRLAVIATTLIGSLVLISLLVFGAVRHVVIKGNERLVHSVAQSVLPALLVNDTQQVETIIKALAGYPNIQTVDLVSAQGEPIASYARAGSAHDLMGASFKLASAENDSNQVYLTAPITFDTLIVANLHIALNLWPTYLRIMIWLGVLLIVPSIIYVFIKQYRVKLRFEILKSHDGSDQGSDSFDMKHAVSSAMEDAGISLEYQPIQRMSDSNLFGIEAVVCWRHPSGQTLHVSPSNFVTLAESSGICLPFDDWFLTMACMQAAAWQDRYGPLILTLNISAAQFSNPAFAQKIRTVCEATQYPYQLLELEVDESVMSREPRRAQSCVQNFAALGLSVTVDNFGLLKSSLDLLEVLPIDKVKLSHKLIKGMLFDAPISDLVETLIKHAAVHDVQVMADGVEFGDQCHLLQRMGCVLGQGTFFYSPLTASNFESFLASRPFGVSASLVQPMNGKTNSQDSLGFSIV
ncbi:EAL domain-containing protein [Limnohabitans sp.]|uniref:EAL domain-containing protein n=1 Tax=Limnohabitans sp. TaxID=1907725 RepID=UPI00286F2EC8|nr:EAL domain-containing protein [Limnohabitans sp.]